MPQSTHGIPEATLRAELAQAFRIIQSRGLNDGLFNHCTVVLDGGETFLINRFGLLWSEVTAENLVEFDATGEIVSGDGPIYAGAGVTHTKVHGYRPENVCCLHLHPPWITALACVEGGLKLVGEVSARFAEPGMFLDDTEPAPAWGNTDSHRILLHPGHGVTCCGPSVAEALDDLLALEAAARLQLLQMGISAARAQPLPVLDAAETIVIMKPWFEGLDKTEEATQALAALAAANTPPSPPNWDGTGPFPSRIQGPEGAATDLAAACRLLNHWGWCDEANGSYTQVALDGNTFMVGDGSMPYATATPESLDATGSPQFGFLLKARGIQATAVIYAHPPSLSDMAQSGEEFLSSVPSPKSPVAYGCTLEDMADAMALAGNECCLALPKYGGVLVTGPTVAEALGALYAAEHAATIQAHAVCSGSPFRTGPGHGQSKKAEEEPVAFEEYDYVAEVSNKLGPSRTTTKADDATALLEAWKRMLAALPAHADFAGYVNTTQAPLQSTSIAAKL